jgi:glycosyltransferase involved in cell wall biosynthesis
MEHTPSDNTAFQSGRAAESGWQPDLSIVIPAYNESAAIGPVLDSALALAKTNRWEIIVVDDGSSDNTAEQVALRCDDHYLTLIRHPYNQGYGAAIKTGIRRARAPLVATMDSDGQHNPDQLMQLLCFTTEYPLVVGMRSDLVHSPIWRMPGKWGLSWMANYLTNQKIPDLNSGMRIFHTDIIRRYLHLCPQGFSFSTTSTMVFFSQGYAVNYTPITVNHRVSGGNSTVRISTGFETFILVMRLTSLFNPLRIFVPASILLILLGLLWGFPYILLQRGVSVGSLMLILSGLLVFFFGLLTDQVAQLRLEKFE